MPDTKTSKLTPITPGTILPATDLIAVADMSAGETVAAPIINLRGRIKDVSGLSPYTITSADAGAVLISFDSGTTPYAFLFGAVADIDSNARMTVDIIAPAAGATFNTITGGSWYNGDGFCSVASGNSGIVPIAHFELLLNNLWVAFGVLAGGTAVATAPTTVSSVAFTGGTGLSVSGSPITGSGTIALALAASGVAAGTYGLPTVVTVDALGRVEAISSAGIGLTRNVVDVGRTTPAYAAAIVINCATDNVFDITLTGNATLALTNTADGASYKLYLAQDSTGSRTITWPSGTIVASGGTLAATTTANACDLFLIQMRGTILMVTKQATWLGAGATPAAAPGTVPNVRLQRLTNSTAVIQWDNPTRGGTISLYNPHLIGSDDSYDSSPVFASGGNNVFYFGGMNAGDHYTASVRAGSGTTSAPVWGPYSTISFRAPSTLDYLGVNLSGAEFGNTNMDNSNGSGVVNVGVLGTDYTWPTTAEIDYFVSYGMNVFRICFLIERMQPKLNGPLDPTYLAAMDLLVAYAATKNCFVLLDPHNYGYMQASLIGSTAVPNSDFAYFHGLFAAHYATVPNVIFGLMNEPNVQLPAPWAVSCNAAIAAIRAAETTITHQINAPGTYHQNGASYVSQDNSDQFAQAIVDSGNQTVFEIHQYNDPDQSGSETIPSSATIGVERLEAVTTWARSKGFRLFLGEFGSIQDELSVSSVSNVIQYMITNKDVWQGGTQWAGGPWWSDTFGYRLEAYADGTIPPEMTMLAGFRTVPAS